MALSLCSATTMKAVVLPFMVLMAMAAAPSICAAEQAGQQDDAAVVAKADGQFSDSPLGRKLLQINICGLGSAPQYSCPRILPLARIASCCPTLLGRVCLDVTFDPLHCGVNCTQCVLGQQLCCTGTCVNFLTDKNNCGVCGRVCPRNLPCVRGFCGYI